MQHKPWGERFADFIRPYLFWLLLPATPIGVYGSAKMVVLAVEAWPWWVAWPVIISQFLILLGLAAAIDSQQERLKMLEAEQAERPHLS